MKTKNLKIVYINGYNGHLSNKPETLSKLTNFDIKHIKVDYANFNLLDITTKAKDADIIIASSLGAYVARGICLEYNIPLIGINPVIDVDKVDIIPNEIKTKVKTEPTPDVLTNITFLAMDDDIINPEITLEKYKNTVIVPTGGHTFKDLNLIKDDLIEFIKHAVLYK